MATIQVSKTTQPTTINKFLGLNLSNTGDTQIALGESGNMTNFYITDDFKLRKMYGYKTFHQYNGKRVKGMFATKIKDTEYLLVVAGGILYSFNGGTLANDYDVSPEKSKSFVGDGETVEFDLQTENIESVDKVIYNTRLVDQSDYSVDLANGIVTMNTAPDLKKSLKIEFTKHIAMTTEGTLTLDEDADVSFFEFDNKVYILCGKYKRWNPEAQSPTPRLQDVTGYVPTVFVNSYPTGGGVIYDEINMLNPQKKQKFNGDNSTATYQLAQKNIASVDSVIVNGATKTVGTHYNVNTTNGTITFTSGNVPPVGNDNVEITWSKNDGYRAIIEGMKFGTIFGGDVDTRVFVYGNPNCQNRVYFSGTTFENGVGVPSVEYFPATSQLDIGPANFAVTDLTRQYDRLLATTNKPEAYYLTISTEQIPVTVNNEAATRYVPSVGTFPLNESHGNVAPGQGRLLNNYPATFENGAIIMWKATNVRDEKNMEEISRKIKIDLDKIPMHLVKTLDLQEKNQLWVVYDTKIWIYNYGNQTFSRLNVSDYIDNITSLNGDVYVSTLEGKVMKFSETFTDYDGETIESYWEMNFSDFGVPYLRKTMSRLWVLMQPQNWSSADISFISNVAESAITKHIEYKKQWFDNLNFSDFTFKSSINPQPFKLKLKAKKFTNLKITIKNTENSTCTILSLVLHVESFGYSK